MTNPLLGAIEELKEEQAKKKPIFNVKKEKTG